MKLALGTAQFGLDYGIANKLGQVSHAEAGAIVRRARAAGITTIDTAVSYGDSESRLGQVGVEGFSVISKLPSIPDTILDIRGWMFEIVERSLENLRLDNLYGLLLHRPDQLLEPRGEEIYQALGDLKREGLVGKIGASIYEPSELDAFYVRFPLDLVQSPFNLFDRRIRDSGWMTRLKEEGSEVHVRSIFLQGLLLFQPGERPRQFERWSVHFDRYDAWLRTHGLTPLEACVADALSISQIDRVVVGVDSAAQLEAILAAASVEAPAPSPELTTMDPRLLNPASWMQA